MQDTENTTPVSVEGIHIPDGEMPALELSGVEQTEPVGGPVPNDNDIHDFEPVSLEELKNVLSWTYKAGAWYTKYEDIWAVDDEELTDICIRLLPKVNSNQYVAGAVKTVDLESVWLMLAFSYGRRIWETIKRRRQERLAALQAEQEGGDSFGHDAYSQPAL